MIVLCNINGDCQVRWLRLPFGYLKLQWSSKHCFENTRWMSTKNWRNVHYKPGEG